MSKNKATYIANIQKKDSKNTEKNIDLLKLSLNAVFYALLAFVFSILWFNQIMYTVALNYKASNYLLEQFVLLILLIFVSIFPKRFGLPVLGLGILGITSGILFRNSFGMPIFDFLTRHTQDIYSSVQWMLGSNIEMPRMLPTYFAILAIIISTVFIFIKPMPTMLTLIWVLPYLISIRNERIEFDIIVFFVGLIIILITFARQGDMQISLMKNWQIPPFVLIALVLVVLFALQSVLPTDLFFNAKVNRYLDQLVKSNQNMPDTVRYFEFSIRDAGFYPQNVQLGGPIEQQHLPFMEVTGPAEPFYLRGTVFNQFDKNIWYASSMNKNYLFYNEAPINQQKDAFTYRERSSLSDEDFANYFKDSRIIIEPIYQPIQAIFHGGKPVEIIDFYSLDAENNDSSDELQNSNEELEGLYYFNPAGQLYASKEIPQIGYGVVGQISTLASSNQYFDNLINDYQAGKISFSDQTMTNQVSYQEFLENHEPNLADIVYRDDLDKATQLRLIVDYLKTNFVYNLSVSEISQEQDLFEHFIQTKSGYCTYFATALTILAREAGFESRYVEGFIVQGIKSKETTDINYERVVTTDQAHAWTEIKIDELGWLPFDATPEAGLDAIQRDQAKEEELASDQNEPTHTTSPPQITETTSPTTSHVNQMITEEKKSEDVFNKIILISIIAIVLIGLIVLFLLWRKKRFEERHDISVLREKLNNDSTTIILFIWNDLKQLYEIQFEPLEDSTTILKNIALMMRKFKWKKEDTLTAYRAIEKVLYAEISVSEDEMETLMDVYRQSENFVKQNTSSLKWLFQRFLKAKIVN
ncbi:MAG: transglutaminase domain-containing protein [Clostridiaceae bacterium]|nr:transglutaminase domain-containing protein [Clostridiaceae bacterium]